MEALFVKNLVLMLANPRQSAFSAMEKLYADRRVLMLVKQKLTA
jgi:hypothetical protein